MYTLAAKEIDMANIFQIVSRDVMMSPSMHAIGRCLGLSWRLDLGLDLYLSLVSGNQMRQWWRQHRRIL